MKKITLLMLSMIALLFMANAQTPIAHWLFENDVLDENGNSNGIVQPEGSTILYSDAIEGTASIDFDGSYYLTSDNTGLLTGLGSTTIAFWMKNDAAPTAPAGLFEQDGTVRTLLLTDQRLQFVIGTSDNGWYSVVLESVSSVALGEWNHIAFVWDGANAGIYINGVLDAAVAGVTGTFNANGNYLLIGSKNGHESFVNYTGLMDDFRVYGAGLDPTAVLELYESFGDMEAPTAPANLASSTITSFSVDLAWEASTDNEAVTSYIVYQDDVEIETITDGSLTTTVSGLTPETTYVFTVKAADAAGNISAASNAETVLTIASADTEAPTAPANLASSNITLTSVDLSWDASTDNVGVTSYIVYQDDVEIETITDGSLTTTVSGLTYETTYVFTVKATDAEANLSDASNALSVTTLADTEAPTAPANLASANVGLATVDLSWDESADNVAVVAYEIKQDGDSVQTVTSGLTTMAVGLVPETTYEFTVTAFDASGNESAASNAVSVTTGSLPNVPIDLLAQWNFEGHTDNIVDETGEFDASLLPDGSTEVYEYTDVKEGFSALTFDGVSFLNCGEPVAATEVEAFSLALWAKPNALIQSDQVYQSLIAEESEYRIILAASDVVEPIDSTVVHFVIMTENNSWYSAGTFLNSVSTVNAGEWLHIVATFDGLTTKIYLNGVLDAENPMPVTGKIVENGNALCIGGQETSEKFEGMMDDVRWYQGRLNATEVKDLYDLYFLGNILEIDEEGMIVNTLYPNPAKDKIQIENVPENARVQIIAHDGRMMYETTSKDGKLSIDVNNLKDGMYILTVETNNKKDAQRFIISR